MSLSSLTQKVTYSCNGSTTTFPFTFPIVTDDDLQVVLTDSGGTETVLTKTSNYTVTGQNSQFDNGGNVNTVSYASGSEAAYAYPSGYTLTIYRQMPLTQELDFVESMATLYESFEDGLDKLTMIVQQLNERISGAIRTKKNETPPTMELPAASQRANKYLAFGASGQPVATAGSPGEVPVSSYMETVLDDADAAEARDTLGVTSAIRDSLNTYAADVGSTDAYEVTLDPAPDAYTEGMIVWFKANTFNTTSATLNVNGLGAKSIRKRGTTALATGDIHSAQRVGVIYDGTYFQLLVDPGDPVGSVIAVTSEAAPSGYLECNGSSLSRTAFAALFAVIGTKYGAADSTHFNVPDYRGRFLRGWDHGHGDDPDAASRTKPTATGATISDGDNVGTEQADANLSHNHTASLSMSAVVDLGGSSYGSFAATGGLAYTAIAPTVTIGDDGGGDARPKNTAVMFCIRY